MVFLASTYSRKQKYKSKPREWSRSNKKYETRRKMLDICCKVSDLLVFFGTRRPPWAAMDHWRAL